MFKVTGAKTLNAAFNSLFGKAGIALQYALTQSGPMSMAPSQFGMFTKSDPSRATPDLEYHVQPLSTDKLGDPLHPFPAITVSVCNLRPESVGSVHAATSDPAAQPDIRLNYLSASADRDLAVKAVRQARQIMTARHLARYQPQEILPGPAVQSDDELLQAIGNIATTIFHPVGTCRMGADDRAVVGPRPSRPGRGRAARGRRLDHAKDRLGQHRFAGRDDRREGSRDDQSRARAGHSRRPRCVQACLL